jgi:hypothetical protein
MSPGFIVSQEARLFNEILLQGDQARSENPASLEFDHREHRDPPAFASPKENRAWTFLGLIDL